ncbi:cell wall-binding repeat-containing protein [Glaciibacter psychrotolerans]|uniref:Putative cell wall-binding protein n=1 Tax=Glaciibacter psychrotolerans TaxID=670054 RepID=A0A7Z0EEX3_9MICO|nr:cell wall-binding repeat-containing protein [Leifsonia psychrotolerans]NYJ20251.1 putative cell wall-binding protein [Leifsonia psychrotolerans]
MLRSLIVLVVVALSCSFVQPSFASTGTDSDRVEVRTSDSTATTAEPESRENVEAGRPAQAAAVPGEEETFRYAGKKWAGTTRVEGVDRHATAVKLSQSEFAPGTPIVVITSGRDFPDALSAVPAAAKLGGPILMTEKDALPAVTRAEIVRLAPKNIVIVGGRSAVSAQVETDLTKLARVERISGSSRYETSLAVAKRFFPGAESAFIATGRDFADAILIGPRAAEWGAPVLVVDGKQDALPAATMAYAATIASSIDIVGGVNAVSKGIEKQVLTLPNPWSIERYAGEDRFATQAAMSNGPSNAAEGFVVTAYNFPDALAAGVIAGRRGASLYLSHPSCLDIWSTMLMSGGPATKYSIVGGVKTLGPDVMNLTQCGTRPPESPPRVLGKMTRYIPYGRCSSVSYSSSHGPGFGGGSITDTMDAQYASRKAYWTYIVRGYTIHYYDCARA